MWEALASPVLLPFFLEGKARGKCLMTVPAAATWPVLLTYCTALFSQQETSILIKLADFQKEARRCFAICLMEMLLTGDEHLAL